MTIRLLSEQNIRAVVPTLPEIVALVEQAYRLDAEGKAEVPTKIGVHPDRANTFLHAMPAWVGDARALGMKWISYFPGNFDRGLPNSTGIIILNDPDHRPAVLHHGGNVRHVSPHRRLRGRRCEISRAAAAENARPDRLRRTRALVAARHEPRHFRRSNRCSFRLARGSRARSSARRCRRRANGP